MNIRTLAAAGAALLALGAGSAQAQVFGFGGARAYGAPYGGYGPAQCEVKAQQQRALTGVLGAVIGANTGYGYGSGYGSGYGTSAALGVLGDVMVQGARDRCYQEQAQQYGYGAPGYAYGGYGYDSRGYAPDPYGYGAYGHQSYGQGRPGECRYAPSTIQLPDGRIQQRSVRVCADRYGQFQVR